MKYCLILLMSLMLCNTNVFAQGCFSDNEEAELLRDLREVNRLHNKTGDDSQDSLNVANGVLYNYLTYLVEHNFTIVNDLNRLMYEGMDFSASDDNKCAVFSWETATFDAMHYRTGVLFYKTSDGIHSTKYLNGYAPYGIRTVYTKNKQPVYLLFWEDCFSLNDRFKRVSANVIETRYGEEGFMPLFIFPGDKSDSSSYLEYKYNISSYSHPLDVPDIILSSNKKKLSVPVVTEFGSFSGQYTDYLFNGNKFVLDKPNNNKAIKGNNDGKAH